MDLKIFEADEELKKQYGKKYKYFVTYEEDSKIELFTSYKKAEKFIKELKGGKK